MNSPRSSSGVSKKHPVSLRRSFCIVFTEPQVHCVASIKESERASLCIYCARACKRRAIAPRRAAARKKAFCKAQQAAGFLPEESIKRGAHKRENFFIRTRKAAPPAPLLFERGEH